MKNLSFKQRIEYLWDYYRFHALIVIFFIVFLGYFIFPLLAPPKNELLSIAIIDSTQVAKDNPQTLSDELVSLLEGNPQHDIVNIDTSGGTYDTSSSSTIKLSILLSSVGENDIIICGKDLYEKYNSKGAFSNTYDITNCSKWIAYNYTDYSPVYACIPVSCQHPKQASEVINYLLSND